MNTELEKTERDGDGLDLAQLMDQIKRDAEHRKHSSPDTAVPGFYRQLVSQGFEVLLSPPTSPVPPLKLQPELEKRDHYELNYLLGFQDEAFVKNAYQAILKRDPDDAGLAEYLRQLRSGRYSKIDIISSLRFSPEGQKANVEIAGLGRGSAFRKAYRVPVVGYLLRLAVGIVRLPVLITNFRQLESHTAGQLERVASHVNEAVAQLSTQIREQAEVDRSYLETLPRQIKDLHSTVGVQLNSIITEQGRITHNHDALNKSFVTLQAQMSQRASEQTGVQQRYDAELQGLRAQLEKQVDELIERLQKSRMEIAQQETRLAHLLEGSESLSAVAQRGEGERDHLLDSLYFSLEDTLRGTPEQIREAVKVYLPVLRDAGITADILDVGCGRGEWLEVLRENGFQARGIDTNRVVLQRCKELSLEVVESEALTYLGSLPDSSLNAVTAFHFAEHLPLDALVRFLDETGRTLKPGGLLILETPNPENLIVGSCNFYLDPTHQNPIPIPTLKLLVEARGFRCQEVIKLHPVASAKIEVKDQLTSHINHYLYGPMNYAVVARKPR
ncbi:MAG TPA: methyltransferase domain-containing protein [Pyrinomonadaceae bacterium]|nr:methyltransferase domain-containing protein [Pyrinomonadaceae bacterium]